MRYAIRTVCTICVMSAFLTACAWKEDNSSREINLTENQAENLMTQYVANKECHFDEYLPSTQVATCEIFGVECENDTNIAYVYAYVLDGEYVNFKDTAYKQFGGYGPVKMKIQVDKDNIKYLDSEIPKAGDGFQESVKELFPEKYYLMYQQYKPYGKNGYAKLKKLQEEKIRRIWGIAVSEQYMLDISEDGNYEVVWITDSKTAEKFEIHIKECGKLDNCNNGK